ncbi:hypothetical protein AUK10_01080 [Candidatus Gracilibacteria bacterium CG2_30_37_12]|nr:MAG: hypothetical protein AUK10_01080 [Candidatus Gracilibacteria bacterium CG2_30_37_12]
MIKNQYVIKKSNSRQVYYEIMIFMIKIHLFESKNGHNKNIVYTKFSLRFDNQKQKQIFFNYYAYVLRKLTFLGVTLLVFK